MMKKLLAVFLILALLLPVASFADSVKDELCGRWCFYWDTRPMNETYNNGKPMMSFLINCYDFYIFEDGTFRWTSAHMDTDGSFELNYPAVTGLWAAVSRDRIILTAMGNTYNCSLDDHGRLLFYMVDDLPYPFVKVPSYDFISETSK